MIFTQEQKDHFKKQYEKWKKRNEGNEDNPFLKEMDKWFNKTKEVIDNDE